MHRVQQVLDAAENHGRKVAFVGRSMVRNMGVASDLGLLRIPPGIVVDMKQVEQLEPNRVVLVSTGSQGEPLSALSRMANRSHHQVRIEADDTVVLASSLIPGNENAVYRVINGLSRWGARVVHKGVAKVHVSGPRAGRRAALPAQRRQAVQPDAGPRRVAAPARARRARPADRRAGRPIVLAEDGVVVDLVDGKASIVGAVPCGYVYVDGLEVGDVGESALKDRRILGEEGFISVTVAVDSVTGKIAGGARRSRRPRLHRRPEGVRRGAAAARGRARPGRRRGRRRPAPARPVGTPGARHAGSATPTAAAR